MSRRKVRKHHREASLCRILISAGGTGGHIFPALAVAEYMKKRAIAECVFVGAGRMEMDIVPKAGFKIIGLPIRGFQRRRLWKNWDLPLRILLSCCRAYLILRRFKPHLLFGTGGYVSVPVLLMSAFLRVPAMILEVNAWAGWANRLLGRWVDRVCVSYPNMERFFPAQKVLRTGTPLRGSLGMLPSAADARRQMGLQSDRPTILVLGGSLGAGTLNRCMEQSWRQLLAKGYQLIWQTGRAHYQRLSAQVPTTQGLVLKPFLEKMDEAYGAATLIVARAGALTIAELIQVAKPTILVPADLVTEDHQRRNAEVLAQKGACYYILDRNADAELQPLIEQLMQDAAARDHLIEHMHSLSMKQHATATIAAEIIKQATRYMKQQGKHLRLVEADLSSVNFSKANFSGADLSSANFSGADLSSANFSGADRLSANFSLEQKAIKHHPRDEYLDLSGLDLSEADCRGADCSFSNFSEANFSGANLPTDLLDKAGVHRQSLPKIHKQ